MPARRLDMRWIPGSRVILKKGRFCKRSKRNLLSSIIQTLPVSVDGAMFWCDDRPGLTLTRLSGLVDYAEMVTQFGYITIWSVTWPLSPLFALINNWFELRTDAAKIATQVRRPIAERVESIGPWLQTMVSEATVSSLCWRIGELIRPFDFAPAAIRHLVVFRDELYLVLPLPTQPRSACGRPIDQPQRQLYHQLLHSGFRFPSLCDRKLSMGQDEHFFPGWSCFPPSMDGRISRR